MPAAGADMFLKVAGIETSYKDHKVGDKAPVDKADGWIPINHWSWGATQHGTFKVGSKALDGGRADVQDLTITHDADKASAILTKFCLGGEGIAKIELMCRNSGAKYLTLKMDGCAVSHVTVGGSNDGSGALQMSFGIHFNSLVLATYEENKPTEASWVQT
jgi:type VI secretion system secreted protein Hcp